MYSKESCNNLANIIHGHGPFRLERRLHDLHSAAAGWLVDKEGGEMSDGHLGLTLTQCHNIRVWPQSVTWTIVTRQPLRLSVCPSVSCCWYYKAGHVIIWTHLRAGPGSAHATGHSGLWGRWTAIIGFPSQAQALDHPHLDGARVLWKYFYCAQNNFCQHKYIFPQRFQSRQGKNQVVY